MLCFRVGGWWPVVTGLAGDALNLVVLLSCSTPTHGHTLVTYTLTDNRTTSMVDRTGTTIELNQWARRKNPPTS